MLEPPEVESMEDQVGKELPTRITLPIIMFVYLFFHACYILKKLGKSAPVVSLYSSMTRDAVAETDSCYWLAATSAALLPCP